VNQDNPIQAALQPYVKLVQSNMELLGRYSKFPEAMTQAMAKTQSLLRPGHGTPSSRAQPPAFAELVQGMVKNHASFMEKVAQSGIAMLAQGQAALLQQTQQATERLASSAKGRARRSR
jgi:hypothetical protein